MDNMPGSNNNNNTPGPGPGGPNGRGPGGPAGPGGQRPGGGNRRARDLGFYALILVILLATVFSLTNDNRSVELNYSEIIDLFEAKQVESFVISGNELYLYLREPYEGQTELVRNLRDVDLFYQDLGDLIREQKADGILKEYDDNEGFVAPWWLSFLPYLIVLGVFGVLWYVMMTRATGGGAGGVAKFSKARTKVVADGQTKKTFADVAGCDEEKEELQEIVWSSSRTPRPIPPWAPVSPRVCCWWALRVPVRP